ncbi:PUA-like domain-containing protein [Xylariales sp. PMI_506]|nr:PUA-like domain-containing protein [Xylariales sp. PMI_506]
MSVAELFVKTHHGFGTRQDRVRVKVRPAPLQASDDGHGRPMYKRPKHLIMTKILTPTISHFNLDGTHLPFARLSWPSRRHSVDSSMSDDELGDVNWDKDTLLALSDSVRAAIQDGRGLGPDVERLSRFLESVVKAEERRQSSVDFETLDHARLDKLLNEILHFSEIAKVENSAYDMPLRFQVDTAHCKKLQLIWRQRFREQYFMVDQLRCAALVRGGRLKDVSFNSALTYDLGKWEARASDPMSEFEGNLQFEAGNWWLNIACAQRDGIVASPLEKPTSGRYGIPALPLLSGKEEIVTKGPSTMVKYVRKGNWSDMPTSLISRVGQQIRILRGHKLKSIYAPRVGIRYDGLYTIRQYGTKLDMVTDTYKVELTLERVWEQIPMETLQMIPKPSQLDDWCLYEKLEGDKIKLVDGDARFLEWSLQQEEERLDREDWKRDCLFRASFPKPSKELHYDRVPRTTSTNRRETYMP